MSRWKQFSTLCYFLILLTKNYRLNHGVIIPSYLAIASQLKYSTYEEGTKLSVAFFIPYCLPTNSSLILFNILHLLFLVVLGRGYLWFAYKWQWRNNGDIETIITDWVQCLLEAMFEFILAQVTQAKVWICKNLNFLQLVTINALSV